MFIHLHTFIRLYVYTSILSFDISLLNQIIAPVIFKFSCYYTSTISLISLLASLVISVNDQVYE